MLERAERIDDRDSSERANLNALEGSVHREPMQPKPEGPGLDAPQDNVAISTRVGASVAVRGEARHVSWRPGSAPTRLQAIGSTIHGRYLQEDDRPNRPQNGSAKSRLDPTRTLQSECRLQLSHTGLRSDASTRKRPTSNRSSRYPSIHRMDPIPRSTCRPHIVVESHAAA